MRNIIPPRKSTAGFTLIELLVVIAIIAILAAILFPVFARARENARRSSCISNLKQISLGVMQYIQDYDEKYPMSWFGRVPGQTYGGYIQTVAGTPGREFQVCDPGSCGSGGKGNFITWMDMIHPYVKSTQLFRCPSSHDGLTVPDYHYSGAYGNTASTTLTDISTGNWETPKYGFPIIGGPTPAAAIQRPAETVMVFEMSGTGVSITNPVAQYQMRGAPHFLSTPERIAEATTHLEGTNLVYGDGHVKWKSISALRSETNGGASTMACNLNAINEALPYCSKLWNPFRP
jgi:prepilin-type N-terminal cleavage/methylation domain-containing protein/prepilin-type processing-associated H-X9-DG protein